MQAGADPATATLASGENADETPFALTVEAPALEPAAGVFDVTPDDEDDFATPARALYVGTGGDVAVVAQDDTEATFVGVPGGTVLHVKTKRVNLTGTTAADIVGLV